MSQEKMAAFGAYSVMQKARYKLNSEGSRSNPSLRIMVGHANLLDSLLARLHSEASEGPEANQPAELTIVEEVELEDEEDGSDEEVWEPGKPWTIVYTPDHAGYGDEEYRQKNEHCDDQYAIQPDDEEDDSDDEEDSDDDYASPAPAQPDRQWHAPLTLKPRVPSRQRPPTRADSISPPPAPWGIKKR